MKWYERYAIAVQAFGDAAHSAWDVVTSPFDEDEDTVGDVLNAALRVPVSLGNFAFQNVAAPVTAGMDALNAVTQPVQDAAHMAIAFPQTAVNLSNSPTFAHQQGVSGASAPLQLMWDADTWSKAWEMAKHTSAGESLAFGGTSLGMPFLYNPTNGVDILDQKKVSELKDSFLFNATSGLNDAVVSWYSDPSAAVGKTIGAARKVSNVYQAGAHAGDSWLERQLFKRTPLGEKNTDPFDLAYSESPSPPMELRLSKPC